MTETVRVSYLPAAMHPLQDTSFNPAPAFSEQLAIHTDSFDIFAYCGVNI